MEPVKLVGYVDDRHQLSLQVPECIGPGKIEVMIAPLVEEDEAGRAWESGIARQWADELTDARQDIYTDADGDPFDAVR